MVIGQASMTTRMVAIFRTSKDVLAGLTCHVTLEAEYSATPVILSWLQIFLNSHRLHA